VFDNPMLEKLAYGQVEGTSAHAEVAAGEIARTAAQQPKPQGEHESIPSIEYILMGLLITLGPIGLWLAWKAYCKADRNCREPINVVSPAVYNTLLNKYYVDEFYDYTVTGRKKIGPLRLGMMGLGNFLWKFDA